MVRYFYAWTPVAVVFATAIVLTIPYLALIVFMVVVLAVLVAVATLTWVIVSNLYARARSVLGRPAPTVSQARGAASARTALNPGGVAGRGAR
jgi:hypothetical protein